MKDLLVSLFCCNTKVFSFGLKNYFILFHVILLLTFLSSCRQGNDEMRWWRGNLHTHSFWSDGDDFPENVAKWYKDNDYNFLAFTDHNIVHKVPVTGHERAINYRIQCKNLGVGDKFSVNLAEEESVGDLKFFIPCIPDCPRALKILEEYNKIQEAIRNE